MPNGIDLFIDDPAVRIDSATIRIDSAYIPVGVMVTRDVSRAALSLVTASPRNLSTVTGAARIKAFVTGGPRSS